MGEEKWQSTARKKVNVTHKIHKGSCAQHVEPCPANAKKAQSEKPVRGLWRPHTGEYPNGPQHTQKFGSTSLEIREVKIKATKEHTHRNPFI